MRPKSIEQFALVYGAVIVLGLISTWLAWGDMLSQAAVQQMIAQFGESSVLVIAGAGVLMQALLWYFISQRGSVVAKWIFVILTGLAIITGLFGIASAGLAMNLNGVIGLLLLVLQAVAMWLVFRSDTHDWFGETYADEA